MKETTATYLDKSLFIIMLGFIFLNPIPHTTTIKEILFYLSCLIFTILVSTKKINFTYKTPLTIPFLLFGLWAFIGLFFALDKPSSIHDYYAHYIKYIILYFILINVFNTQKRFNLLIWAIILSAAGFSSWALIKYYLIMGKPLVSRMGNTSDFPEFITNISELITILALIFSLNLIRGKTPITKKIILAIGLIPLAAATILPQSVSSILSLATALLIFVSNKPKAFLTLTFITAIVFSTTHLSNSTLTKVQQGDPARVFLYLYSIEIIKDYPLLGTGFDLNNFKYIKQSLPAQFEKYKVLPSTQTIFGKYNFFPKKDYTFLNGPHNMFFSSAIRTGITGLLLMGFIMLKNIQTLYRIVREKKDKHMQEWGITLMACFFMFLAKGAFEQVYTHFGDTIFYSMLALTTILWNLTGEKSTQSAYSSNTG